jgi:glucosamine kinase
VAFYLGIDGGGSKTRCVIGDDTSVLATATAGPSNITRVRRERARESLHQAIREACGAARVSSREIHRACIGIAGAGRKEINDAVREIVGELMSGEISVVGDMEIGLKAAFRDGPGVIVIAGTGSIVYGRDSQGRTARAGGWGFAISDEGSAHWIGQSAVRALLRDVDERLKQNQNAAELADSLPLFCEIKKTWQVTSFDELLGCVNSSSDFSFLFPAVVAAAQAGDGVAQVALREAGEELARLAGIVVRRLLTQEKNGASPVPMAMVGGVFRHSETVHKTFAEKVGQLSLRVKLQEKIVEPVEGALEMARQGFNRR